MPFDCRLLPNYQNFSAIYNERDAGTRPLITYPTRQRQNSRQYFFIHREFFTKNLPADLIVGLMDIWVGISRT